MRVSYTFELPMGHRLHRHKGKCRFLHGHNYLITVTLHGAIEPTSGMIIDFHELKEACRTVFDEYDHAFCLEEGDPFFTLHPNLDELNIKILDVPPTAENLAVLWRDELIVTLKAHERSVHVDVHETRDCAAHT